MGNIGSYLPIMIKTGLPISSCFSSLTPNLPDTPRVKTCFLNMLRVIFQRGQLPFSSHRSSVSFAPQKLGWSLDNRTAGFRIVGAGKGTRVECRIPGADANPYLAFASIIAAGLYGIESELEPPKIYEGNVYEAKRVPDVPKTLREALERFAKSKVLRAAFGDDVVEHYLHAGEWEQLEYDRRVTDWELVRGFERA